MDNFGFSNQGKNYQNFRPKYPECLYNNTLSKIKGRNRYLDVAMGTGQLLFKIASQFAFSRGTDISEKMLETSKSKLLSEYHSLKDKVVIEKCDVMDLKDEEDKYDLITVGQALHWFPVAQSLKKMKSLLRAEGKLLILSYVMKGVQNEDQDNRYKVFYSKVKPLFDFDRDELHNHYTQKTKYPFEQIFGNVVRFEQQVKIQMTRTAYVNYLKTYSGYNQYLLKHPQQQDPIKIVQEGKQENVMVVFDYFKVECGI